MRNHIKLLRSKFKQYGIDGYVIPKNDDFFTEYSRLNRLEVISNFSGSAGLAIILKDKNSYFEEEANLDDDFEFNQDFEIEESTRSPGWLRYQKRIK